MCTHVSSHIKSKGSPRCPSRCKHQPMILQVPFKPMAKLHFLQNMIAHRELFLTFNLLI